MRFTDANAREMSLDRFRSTDRRLLEDRLLPVLLGDEQPARQVLFVGCCFASRHYENRFSAQGVHWWTLDCDPKRRVYGAQHHIVDRLERLEVHRTPLFDLIVCNGVLGWGLNDREDAEAAFAACFARLRVRGRLLVGWNDYYPRNRIAPQSLISLLRYDHHAPCGWPPSLPVGGLRRHVFEFYRRPPNATSPAR